MRSLARSIAMIIPGLDRIGGAEQQLLLLARGLHARGWRVSVVALSGAGGVSGKQLIAEGIGFTSLGMRKGLADPLGWIRFNRWLRQHRPDVVHAHLPHAAWLARWSRLAAPMPVLVDTVHTSATGELGRRVGYRCSRWLPDQVSAVSQAVAQAYLKARMVSEKTLTVLPNGVDVSHWKPDPLARESMRRKLHAQDEFIFLAAGRLDPVKDYPTLLAALAGLPEMAGLPVSARLVIAGAGPLENSLRQLAAELGIADRVEFLGFQPDLYRWMQAADAFVLSSLWEGLSMGILEAAACGLPSVATDVPGTREAVMDGKTGFLATAADPPAFQAALARMMALPRSEREAMGRKARQFIVERFSLEQVLDRWESLYNALLARIRKSKR